MKILKAIKSRRSIRRFKSKAVKRSKILKILEAGRWAPSGYNNQPWRFCTIKDKNIMDKLASYSNKWDEKTIDNCSMCICVFADKRLVYDNEKDNQAIGACIQNMLLESYEQGLGTCWIGGILKNRIKVNKLLKLPKRYELKALIALGYPNEKPKMKRKNIGGLILATK